MRKYNPWIDQSLSREQEEKAVAEFLNSGGKILKLKDDDGSYDKNMKKTENRLIGGFNPFTKDQALSKRDEE